MGLVISKIKWAGSKDLPTCVVSTLDIEGKEQDEIDQLALGVLLEREGEQPISFSTSEIRAYDPADVR